MPNIAVIGGTGDVGQGIVSAALDQGWAVAACGRDRGRLDALAQRLARPGRLVTVQGDIGNESGAAALLDTVRGVLPTIDGVVVAINAPNTVPQPLLAWTAAELTALLEANLVSHFLAAKTLIPALAPGGTYISIGGGTADFIIPNSAQLSVCQAAQRMMLRGIAKEHGDAGTHVRELIIVSMVNGEKKREIARPDWLTDAQIGMHVLAILANPGRFSGPVLTLKFGDPIG